MMSSIKRTMNGDQIMPSQEDVRSAILKDKRFSWKSGFYDSKSKRVTAGQMLLWEQNGASIEAVRFTPKVKRGLAASADHWLCKVFNDFESELFRCTDYQWRVYLAKKNNEALPISPSEEKQIEAIKYESSWSELFGEKPGMKRPEYRKAAWGAWKKTVKGRDRFLETLSGQDCTGCKHKDGDWCTLIGLPCIYNPTIPDKIGLACAGLGREEVEHGS